MAQQKKDLAQRQDKRDLGAFSLFWKSFKEIKGLVTFALSTIIGLALKKWFDVLVPLWIVVLAGAFVSLLLVALMNALMEAVSLAKAPREITVLECTKAGGPYPNAHAVLVLHAPDGLPNDATVAVYRLKGALQEHIGIGTVQHQQDHETYQVTLDGLYPDVDVASLFDLNVTPVSKLSARLEVSMGKAAQSRRPVTKAQFESAGVSGGTIVVLPLVGQNPALPEATVSSSEVEK